MKKLEKLTIEEYGFLRETLGRVHDDKNYHKGVREYELIRTLALKLKVFI